MDSSQSTRRPPRRSRQRVRIRAFGAVGVALGTAVLSTAPGVAAVASPSTAVGVTAPAGTAADGRPGAAPTVTAPTGWLRVAHLVPAVGPVDIYLTPVAGPSTVVQLSAAYGAFTAYRPLPPGVYGIAMRAAGTGADSPPVLRWSVRVQRGHAYTVAAVGTPRHLQNRILTDDLTRPAAGKGRVRLIQGAPAAESVTVTAVRGPLLAQDVPYGAVTGYADVPQGRWTLQVEEAGTSATTTVDVRAGGVYSLVVVQRPDGALRLSTATDVPATGRGGVPVSVDVLADAAAPATAPRGSVDTGEGGLAASADRRVPPVLPAVLGGGLAVVAAVIRRRRSAATGR